MTRWVSGVDMSYTELTPAAAQALKASGVQVVAQCLWTGTEQPPHRVTNLHNAQDAGLAILGYASITPSTTGRWHMMHARAGVPDDLWAALIRVAVDVELPGLTIDIVGSALEQMVAYGKRRDIYTNYNTWANILGNPQHPPNCGLWNAYWDGEPDIDFTSWPCGGWTETDVWGEQYQGDTPVVGLDVDLDSFDADALGLPQPAPVKEPDVIDESDLRLGAMMAMATHYKFKVYGTNPVGQIVLQLLEQDGSVSQPPSFIAINRPSTNGKLAVT